MRAALILCGLVLCTSCTGCLYTSNVYRGWDFFTDSVRNLGEAPLVFGDEVAITCRNRRLAREAWVQVRDSSPNHFFSVDYGKGFRAGFADYLDAGGTGEPPVVPPFRYQLICYKNPEGKRATEDWFAGFRNGSAAARDSGMRDLILVPVTSTPRPAERPYDPVGLDRRGAVRGNGPPVEMLPPPTGHPAP